MGALLAIVPRKSSGATLPLSCGPPPTVHLQLHSCLPAASHRGPPDRLARLSILTPLRWASLGLLGDPFSSQDLTYMLFLPTFTSDGVLFTVASSSQYIMNCTTGFLACSRL